MDLLIDVKNLLIWAFALPASWHFCIFLVSISHHFFVDFGHRNVQVRQVGKRGAVGIKHTLSIYLFSLLCGDCIGYWNSIRPHSLAHYLIFVCIVIKRHDSFCTYSDGRSSAGMVLWCGPTRFWVIPYIALLQYGTTSVSMPCFTSFASYLTWFVIRGQQFYLDGADLQASKLNW